MRQLQSAVKVFRQAFNLWWSDWLKVVMLNIVWLLCSVTIVLAPPALFALIAIMREAVYGREIDPKQFFQFLRTYALVSWLWMLLNLFVLALLIANLLFYGRFSASAPYIALGVFVPLYSAWLMVQFYAVPFMVTQETPRLITALRNGLYTFFAAPIFGIVVFAFSVFILLFSIGIFVLFFVSGAALFAILANTALYNRLESFGAIAPSE